jgi:hypothetical protein
MLRRRSKLKQRDEPNFFDGIRRYSEKRETNRQASYENKVCRKLINRVFQGDPEEKAAWLERLERSDEALMELEELLHPYALKANRVQSWSINDLVGHPRRLDSMPLWEEFARCVASSGAPGRFPAMFFYNSVIEQDMVIHTNLASRMPKCHFRLVRTSSSGDGGVVVDTMDGFLESVLGRKIS